MQILFDSEAWGRCKYCLIRVSVSPDIIYSHNKKVASVGCSFISVLNFLNQTLFDGDLISCKSTAIMYLKWGVFVCYTKYKWKLPLSLMYRNLNALNTKKHAFYT